MYTINHRNNLNHLLITLINSYRIIVHINHNFNPFIHNSFTSSITSHVHMSFLKFLIFNSTVLLSITNTFAKFALCWPTILIPIILKFTIYIFLHILIHTPICIHSYTIYALQGLVQLLNVPLKQSHSFKIS